MAAPTIKLRRSSTTGSVPTTSQLALGEVAINTFDGKLFIKKDNGSESIVEVGASSSVNLSQNNTNNETVFITFADGSSGSQGLETDTGLTYNPSTNTISSNITNATLAANVNLLINNTSNETVFIPFADGSSGSQRLETDTGLTYNPSTNTISSNITNATLASRVDLLINNTEDETLFIPFADGSSGSQRLETDTGLTYNPSTNTISSNITNATLAANIDLLSNNSSNETVFITFADGFSGSQRLETDTGLTYNPSTNTISSNITNATLAANIDLLINNSSDETVFIPFADGSSGSQRLETDTGLTYNPSTNTISSNITNANVASLVDLGNTATDPSCFLTFVRTAGGDQQIHTNSSNLTYDASTNTISANLTGTASTATDADKVVLENTNTDTTCFPVFVRGTTGTQQITTNSGNLTYDASTNTISANITNANVASLVDLENNASDTSCFLTFVRTAGGDQQIHTNSSNLTYNADTNTISANLSGNASTATAADEVVLGNTNTDTTCFPLFVRSTTGNQEITTNSGNYTYNASTNTISANTSGNASTATDADKVVLGNNASDTSCFLTFVRSTTGTQEITTNSSNLTYDASTNTISANLTGTAATASALETNATGTNLTLSGNLTVNGSTVTLNTTTLDVSDLNITVASGASDSAAANGAGITVDGANATFNYSHSGTKWVSNKDIEAEAFIKNGGTSSQFLKADGSVDTSTYLTSFTETNDLSSAVTWANVPNANITASSVTQHQASLSITESQISDLQTYLTSYTETDPVVGAISGIVKANGSGTISAAVAGTDYLTPSGNGSSLTNVDAATLDGVDSTSFLRSDVADIKTSGNLTFNDDIRAQFGSSNDLSIFHKASSSNSIIEHTGTAGDLMLNCSADDQDVVIMADNSLGGLANYFVADGSTGESILYYYGNQKLATKSGGVDITGDITLRDDDEIRFGDDNDAKINVDGSQNFVIQGDGTTYLRGSTVIIGANGGAGGFETGIRVNEVSSETSRVELYYDNNIKLQTMGGGVNVTGTLEATSIFVDARFEILYNSTTDSLDFTYQGS